MDRMNIRGGVRPAASLPHLNGGRQENNRGNVIHLCVQRAYIAHPLPPHKIALRSIVLIGVLLVLLDSFVVFEMESHNKHLFH